MTEKLQAFFASKKTQAVSFWLGLLALLLALLCFIAPLSRQKRAVESLGETSLDNLSPLAMAMVHYEPQRLRYLIATGATGPTYDDLVELMAQSKKQYGFSRLYLVYQDDNGELRYLADADYDPAGDDSVQPGHAYLEGYYDNNCKKQVEGLLENKRQESYLTDIYNGNLVLSFAPLRDQQTNEVLAVLGADAALRYTDFSRVRGVELSHVAEGLLGLFVLCVVSLFMGRSFSVRDDSKNSKNDKNQQRRFQKPTVTQQENNVYIDPLDDVDPSDYL